MRYITKQDKFWHNPIGKDGTTREQKLQKALSNYNHKVNQHMKKDDSISFPKFKKKDVMRDITNAKELNELVRELNKVNNKTAFKKVKNNENLELPRVAVSMSRYFKKRSNELMLKVKNEYAKLDRTTDGKKTGFTVGDTNMSLNSLRYKPTELDAKNFKMERDFNKWFEQVGRKSFSQYYDKRDRICKQNYLATIAEWFGHGNDEALEMLYNKVKSMPPHDVAVIIASDYSAAFVYLYGDEGVNKMLSDIAAAWFPDPNHKIFSKIDTDLIVDDSIRPKPVRK